MSELSQSDSIESYGQLNTALIESQSQSDVVVVSQEAPAVPAAVGLDDMDGISPELFGESHETIETQSSTEDVPGASNDKHSVEESAGMSLETQSSTQDVPGASNDKQGVEESSQTSATCSQGESSYW